MPKRDNLPPLLHEIAAHIGLDAAIRLSAACGGQRYWISSSGKIPPGHPWCSAVGYNKANRIGWAFRGETITIPLYGRRHARDEAVRRAYRNGKSIAELIDEFGLSGVTIRHILDTTQQKNIFTE